MPTKPPTTFPDIGYFRDGHYLAPCPKLEPFPEDTVPEPSVWQLAVVAQNDSTVSVYFLAGERPCYGLRSIPVHDSTNAVTLTLFLGQDPEAGQCNLEKQWYVTTTHLIAPLGGRALVSGATVAPGQPEPLVEHL